MNIKITRTKNPKIKPNPNDLSFGTVFTDHMFIMPYDEGQGWHDPEIKPYEKIELDPAAAVLHYAQEIFEGMKTYKGVDGGINLFRPYANARRSNSSAKRLIMPTIDENDYVEAIKTLVMVDKDWIPDAPDTSLYIRPYVFATEPFLGVRLSKSYYFMIILSPVGPYYKEGLSPTKMFVEDEYVRAGVGGTGSIKTGGNYASSLASQKKAQEMGFSQVLWLDSKEHKFIEEIGTSNAFFVIGDTVVTPGLFGSILPGITRDSCIKLLKDWGIRVEERKLEINEIFRAAKTGGLKEVFASGTATVISPVGELKWKDKDIIINNREIGGLSQKLYDTITGIQSGKLKDKHDWVVKL
jgi:branched-chain amino acid aminotransferase